MDLKIFNYQRGEVYLVQEDNPVGSEIKKTRPWVLMGANPLNKARKTLIAMPLSTQAQEITGLTVKVFIKNTVSCVVIDQIRALDKRRFLRLEGTLSHPEIQQIEMGLKQILCL